jgi:ketosteroid isomerase-like protein
MGNISIGAVFVILVLLPFRSDSKKADLMDTIDCFYEAIEKNDVETRIGLLADDVILLPNHWRIMKGKKAVSESFRRAAGAVFKLKDREIVSSEIDGDLAYTVNAYYYTYHAIGEEPCWHRTKNVHIWRCEQGRWKLAVDIWNSDVGLKEFERE